MKPIRLALFLTLLVFHLVLVTLVWFFPVWSADGLLGDTSEARFLVLFGLIVFLITFGIVWLDRQASRRKIERLEAEKDKIKAEVFDMRQREQEVEREIASFRSSLPSEKSDSTSLPSAKPNTPPPSEPAVSEPAAGEPTTDKPAADEAEYGTLEPRPGSALDNDDDEEPPRS